MVHLDLGGMTVRWLGHERFHLDAGAMFGPVPRVLWWGKYPADADNFSPFVATPLLVQTGNHHVVIDTGLGNRLSPKQIRNFRVSYPLTVPAAVEKAGLEPEDIDFVILTHLDWDHAAGIVEQGPDGLRLRFPKALHMINAIEWHDAHNPNSRTQNTYWAQNWELLVQSGRYELVEESAEVVPGVRVKRTGGHTRGHMIVELAGAKETAYHLADLLPTHAHLNPLWVTAYDNFPLDSVAQKERWLATAKDQRAWLLFYHDALYAAIRLNTLGDISETVERSWNE